MSDNHHTPSPQSASPLDGNSNVARTQPLDRMNHPQLVEVYPARSPPRVMVLDAIQHSGRLEADLDDAIREIGVLKRKNGHQAENEGRRKKRGRRRRKSRDTEESDSSGSEGSELDGGRKDNKDAGLPAAMLAKAKLEARRVGKQFSLMYALLLPALLNDNLLLLLKTDISGNSNPNKIEFTKDPNALTLKLARDFSASIPEAHHTAGYTAQEWYIEEVRFWFLVSGFFSSISMAEFRRCYIGSQWLYWHQAGSFESYARPRCPQCRPLNVGNLWSTKDAHGTHWRHGRR
jgi:hypothetical protein